MRYVNGYIQYLSDFGWDIERYLYRSLFTTLLSTPFNDSAKLSLLQQLYLDIGPIFNRHNFHSLVQFALQFDPLSSNTRLGIRTGSNNTAGSGGAILLDLSSGDLPSSSSSENKSSDFSSSLFDTNSSTASVAGTSDRAVNPGLVAKVNDISKLLKLSETEKFALLVCLNEHNCCEREIDLEKCQFSTSSEITHFILTQLTISNSPRANNLALKIQEGGYYFIGMFFLADHFSLSRIECSIAHRQKGVIGCLSSYAFFGNTCNEFFTPIKCLFHERGSNYRYANT